MSDNHNYRFRESRNTLWVGDIDPSETEKFFEQALNLLNVPFKYVKIIRTETGAPKGYGFICFNDDESALRFLNDFNGSPIPNSTVNKPWKLNTAGAKNRSRPGSSMSSYRPNDRYPNERYNDRYGNEREREHTIFVGTLSPEVDDEMLLEAFKSRYPSVYSAKVITQREEERKSKGFGFVQFRYREEQQRAIQECKETPLVIGECAVRVAPAIQQTYPRTPGTPQRKRFPSVAHSLPGSYNGEAAGDGITTPPVVNVNQQPATMYQNAFAEANLQPLVYPQVAHNVPGYPAVYPPGAQGYFYISPEYQQWQAALSMDPSLMYQYQQQMAMYQQQQQQQQVPNQYHVSSGEVNQWQMMNQEQMANLQLQQQQQHQQQHLQLSRGQSPMTQQHGALVSLEQQQLGFQQIAANSAASSDQLHQATLCNQEMNAGPNNLSSHQQIRFLHHHANVA
ncbi:tRNA selenocysteine 1-associated protein 1 [Halotydeus destructor]|nr:tRNA selenocysteine 1-associated protein 1 [Halotydeus destructor]